MYYNPIGTALRTVRKNLTTEEIIKKAPAAGAVGASQKTSDKYTFVPTIQVVDALRDFGFHPVEARQTNARQLDRTEFASHEIRLASSDKSLVVGDVQPEIVLKNSHDTGSSFQATLGLYRAVCANGLLVNENTLATVRERHVGIDVNRLLANIGALFGESAGILDKVEDWGGRTLDLDQAAELLYSGAAARWGVNEETHQVELPRGLKLEDFIKPKRDADKGHDLWKFFNVIQENVLRGGQSYVTYTDRGRAKRNSVRAVKNIDSQRKINQQLWGAAEAIAC